MRLKRALTEARDIDKSPMRGHRSIWQTLDPFETKRVSRSRVRRYLEQTTGGAPYTLSDEQLAEMDRTLRALREAGVEVALFEVPLASLLESELPVGIVEGTDERMRALAGRHGVTYLSIDELAPGLEPSDFREQSHLNVAGGHKMAAALARAVVAPWAAGHEPDRPPARLP
jgi:hypothetical protein